MRMQGLVDQMQAAVLRLDGWGIALRDIRPLARLPAMVAGRPIWLCWRLGERVAWWRGLAGFRGQARIEDLA
jgi:hypothetical protein